MKSSIVRLGLIGAGKWGRNYISTTSTLSNVRLISVASRNPITSSLVNDTCIIEMDWRNLIMREDIDGVIVSTPASTHAKIALKCLSAGLPLLIEKPLTNNLKDAEEILKVAKEQNSLVMVDHIHLYHPAFRSLKNYSNNLGELLSIKTKSGGPGPFRKDVSALWDWGSHDIAMCLAMKNELPKSTEADYLEKRAGHNNKGESIKVKMHYKNGTHADLEISNLLTKKERIFKAEFEHGTLIYSDQKSKSLIKRDNISNRKFSLQKDISLPYTIEQPLTCLVKEFANAILSKKKNISDLRTAVDVINILEKLSQNLREKE